MTAPPFPQDDDEWDRLVLEAVATHEGIYRTINTDIAFASMLGFDAVLGTRVLEQTPLQDQLRRYWSEHGVPSALVEIAKQDTELGRLHLRLIEVAGPKPSGTVIHGPWVMSPAVPAVMAADDIDRPPAFQATRGGGAFEYLQYALPGGRCLIEFSLSADLADDFDLVLVRAGDEQRLLVIRANGDRFSASLEIASDGAWGDGAITVEPPVGVDGLRDSLLPVVTSSVKLASPAERNDWRALARNLPEEHPATRAVLDGLK